MKRTIAVMCLTLACNAGASVFAQMPKEQMGKKPMMKDHEMTVSGCVAAGKDAGEYMLTSAMMMGAADHQMGKDPMNKDQMGKDQMGKDHMTKPATSGEHMAMSGEHMMSYQLVGGDLKAHLGHKVEVMGTMSKMDMERMGKMDKMDQMAKDKAMSDKAMKAMKLNVTSVKMIAATCS